MISTPGKSKRVMYGFSPLEGLGDAAPDIIPDGGYGTAGYQDPFAPVGSSTNNSTSQLSVGSGSSLPSWLPMVLGLALVAILVLPPIKT